MINGVIFDMDGTMFDTERMWATFWDPALKALGLPYKEGLAEAARGTAGETTRNVVRSFYGPDCDADGIVESLHRVADEVFLSAPVPKKPGLDALLAWLDEQRLPMAVASSSREAMIRNNLDQWGMTHYFKAIVSGQHVAHSKPDPEIFLAACKGLNVRPEEAIGIEDAAAGVDAINAAGMLSVGIGPGLNHAGLQLHSTQELTWERLTAFWASRAY